MIVTVQHKDEPPCTPTKDGLRRDKEKDGFGV